MLVAHFSLLIYPKKLFNGIIVSSYFFVEFDHNLINTQHDQTTTTVMQPTEARERLNFDLNWMLREIFSNITTSFNDLRGLCNRIVPFNKFRPLYAEPKR